MHVQLRRVLRPKQPLLPLSQMRVFHHACATPFSTLQLCCDTLLQQSNSVDIELVEQLSAATKRLIALHSEIAAPTASQERFRVARATNDVLPLFRRPDVTLTLINSVPTKTRIPGSQVLFQEMIVCLVNNAIASYGSHAQKIVVLALTLSKNNIHISVCDFGKGIKRILPLKNIQRQYYISGRAGVGLPFVKETVRRCFYGSFSLISQEGMGTRMVIQIPLVEKMSTQSL